MPSCILKQTKKRDEVAKTADGDVPGCLTEGIAGPRILNSVLRITKTDEEPETENPGETWRSLLGTLPRNLYCCTNAKNIFFRSHDAFEFLFEDVKPLPDIFKVPATRENDFS